MCGTLRPELDSTHDHLHHILLQNIFGISQVPMLKSKWTPDAVASLSEVLA
jgi:hypothetical protein